MTALPLSCPRVRDAKIGPRGHGIVCRGPEVGFNTDLIEGLIGPRLFEVPQELAIIGRLLDEGCFLEPIRRKFAATKDRSCILVETYTRTLVETYMWTMYGKRRYRWGFFGALERIVGPRLQVEYAPLRLGNVKHSVADISVARETIGYEPNVAFEEGLLHTLRWCQNAL